MKTATKKKRRRVKRIIPKRQRELAAWEMGAVVAGVDEVGRGAWAGPVVAGAVILDPGYRIRKAYDSKLMKATERERLAKRIQTKATAVGIGVANLDEVNQFGLTWAVRTAGYRAVKDLATEPTRILLDGNHNYFAADYQCDIIIDGDCYELCIAAASIVAKVHRDRLMAELDERHPGYHFAQHKGYGTLAHRRAIKERGISPAHRTGWAPIMAELQTELFPAVT